jgi:O-Antigen ligase
MNHASAIARPPGELEAAGWRDLGLAAVVVLLAWVPGALVPTVGAPVAWGLTAVAAVVAGLLAWQRPLALLLALLPATLLVATGLIPDAGRYQPTAVVVAPLGLIWAWRLVRGEARLAWPEPTVAVSLGAYIAWCAVTTLTSTARASSLVYLGGIVVTLAVIYGAAPALVADARARRAVLAVVAALGMACAVIGLLLAAAGPWVIFGRPVGQYEIIELTLLGNSTGWVLTRVIGPFLASNGQGINCALALVALVALHAGARGRGRALLAVAAAVVLVALLDSMSRNGWLLAILGLGAVAVPDAWRRRPSLAVASTAIMVVAFGLLLVNAVGADRRPDLMAARYGAAGSSVSGDLSAPPPAVPSASPSPVASAAPSASPSLSPAPQGAAPGAVSAGSIALAAAATQAPPSADPSPGPSASAAPAASPTAAAQPAREALRGGSGLTGRVELWKASIAATEQRPILGWGLGEVIVAIAPHVPDGLGLAGLTSHSTWFRMAVETGIPGLLALLAWVLVSGALILRRLWRDPAARTDPVRLAFVGSFLGLTAAATFDTFLLGGVTFMNIYWALAAVLAAAALAPAVGRAPAGPRDEQVPAAAPVSPTREP